MLSFDFPLAKTSSVEKNYTIASTLRKPNSLLVELLFGDYREKRIKAAQGDIVDHIDYVFAPGEIFGFAYKSLGADYKALHQCFVVQTLKPDEHGSVIPGINPGAEILLSTTGATSSQRFRATLQQLQKSGVDPLALEATQYAHLHRLLEAKLSTDYFVTELINQYRK